VCVCQPFYGGRLHKVTGEVKSPAGETVQRVSGEWNASLDFTNSHVCSNLLLSHLYVYHEFASHLLISSLLPCSQVGCEVL